MSENTEILLKLLELKLQALNVYAATGMTWWVSSIVFCGTILATSWVKKDELKLFPLLKQLGAFLTFFFSTIVLFGLWVIFGIHQLHNEVSEIQKAIGIPSHLSENFTFLTYQVAYTIGTISFAIVLYLWVLLLKYILNESNKEGANKAN